VIYFAQKYGDTLGFVLTGFTRLTGFFRKTSCKPCKSCQKTKKLQRDARRSF